MIVLCNGLAKSSSTFIFQIAGSLAELAGFGQEQLRNQYVPNAIVPYKPHPHFVSFSTGELSRWVQSVPTSQLLVVKTHDICTPETERLLISGKIKAINSYRDPRDAAVSLWESALKERLTVDRDKWRFDIPSFQAAIMIVANLTKVNAGWMNNDHTLNVGFHDIAEHPFETAELTAEYLQLEGSSFTIISKYLKNRYRIGEYNIGLSRRYKTYMSLFEEGWSNRMYGEYDRLIATMKNNGSY